MEPQSPDPLPPPAQPHPELPADTPLPSPSSDSFFGRGLLRLLYTNNPFYVISAALVMFGLKRSFQGEALMTHPWHLLGILGGYLLLLSVTAWAVVRFGKVWEDGRMIVLLVLLLLQALAVSFDGILLRDPASGQALLIAGLGLAVALCEGLMWALAVRLPAGYRLPLHLLLAVFFLYPLALVELQPWGDEVLSIGVLVFPVAMGAGFLTLMPAVRCGPDYVPRSTPWGWPLFPWTLFAFLAFGASVRTWYLTISFLPGQGLDSPFGLYFLIPLLLAGAVLLLEWGIVAKNAIVQQIALAATVVMILMAVQHAGPDPAYREFIERLTQQAASPLYMSLVGAVLFVLYAWARRVPAERWLVSLLLLAVFVGPETQRFARLADMQIVPMAALAIMAAWYAWRRPSSLAVLAAVGACLAVLAWATRGTRIMDYNGLLLWHVFAAAALAIRFRYHDPFARIACDAVGMAIAV